MCVHTAHSRSHTRQSSRGTLRVCLLYQHDTYSPWPGWVMTCLLSALFFDLLLCSNYREVGPCSLCFPGQFWLHLAIERFCGVENRKKPRYCLSIFWSSRSRSALPPAALRWPQPWVPKSLLFPWSPHTKCHSIFLVTSRCLISLTPIWLLSPSIICITISVN